MGFCIWELGEECVNGYSNNNDIGNSLAYNNSDTSLPPNGTWTSNATGCVFTISGGSLSTEEFIKKDAKIKLYPNPTAEHINLDFGKVISNATLKLYNTKGQVLTTSKVFSKDKETITINQSAGIYFINVILEDGNQYYYKVVKK